MLLGCQSIMGLYLNRCFIILSIKVMSKSSLNHTQDNTLHKCKPRQSSDRLGALRIGTIDQNHNTADRLEYIRRKYSSKEKSIFTMRGDYFKEPTHNNAITTSSKYLETGKEECREPLRETMHTQASTKSSLSEYGPNNRKHTSSGYLEEMKQRQDRSKEKVCERVENIKKINQKIKNILNKFEIEAPIENKHPRNTLPERKEMVDSSLKNKKAYYVQQQYLRSYEAQETKEARLPTFEVRPSLKKLESAALHVSQNDSLNMTIDESFVIQKYNPSAKQKPAAMQDLINKFCTQIQRDEELRLAKYFFLLNLKEDKHERLQKEFQKRGIKYSLEELKTHMKFTEDQYNPFLEEQPHEDYSRYADAFLSANDFWRSQIFRKFNWSKLKEEGIQSSLVCENREEGVSLSDLVMFVNFSSGNVFKNRDLVVMMRRMGEGVVPRERVFWSLCGDYQL